MRTSDKKLITTVNEQKKVIASLVAWEDKDNWQARRGILCSILRTEGFSQDSITRIVLSCKSSRE